MHMHSRRIASLLLAGILLLCAACRSPDADGVSSGTASFSGPDFPVSVTLVPGDTPVELYFPAMRIATVGEDVFHGLCLLSLQERIVAADSAGGAKVVDGQDIADIGLPQMLDTAEIIAQNVDTVLTSVSLPTDTLDALTSQGISVLRVQSAGSLAALSDFLRALASVTLGAHTGAARADSVVAPLEETILAAQSAAGSEPKPTAFYAATFGDYGLRTAAADSAVAELLSLYFTLPLSGSVTEEDLLACDPAVILVDAGQEEAFRQAYAPLGLTAVETGRVVGIPNPQKALSSFRLQPVLDALQAA